MKERIKLIQQDFEQNPQKYYWGIFFLTFAVYLFRLGDIPLLADEPTRTVVAMEMMFSENYWVPTINGEYYYRKPPVFNWLLILMMKLTGSTSEFVTRLPSVVPLFLFGITIYQWLKEKLSIHTAFLAAMMFITCGRMLIYASFLGHIDILYSWVTFLGFILAMKSLKEEKWGWFFFGTYAIHGVCFLMKGLPSFLFAGITPVALLLCNGYWKKIFNYRHFLAVGLFALIVGAYFYQYAQYNDVMGWVDQLWDQSKQRTVLDKKWYDSILNLFTFPLDQFVHLAPFLFWVPVFFVKGLFKQIKENYWLRNISVIMLFNLPPYWLSPGYYPRYLFMLYPLLLILLAHFYFQNKEKVKLMKVVDVVIGVVIFALALHPVLFFFGELQVDYKWLKTISLALVFVLIGIAYFKSKSHKYLWLVLTMVFVRLGFSWFVFNDRIQNGPFVHYKEDAIKIAKDSGDERLTVFGRSTIDHTSTHYIETIKKETLSRNYDPQPGDLVLIAEGQAEKKLALFEYETISQMTIRYQHMEILMVRLLSKKTTEPTPVSSEQ